MKHVRGILTRRTGTMERVSGAVAEQLRQDMRGRPKHSGRLGPGVWSRLHPEDRARIRAALKDAAAHYKCRQDELMWSMSPQGVLHISKRERIVL